MKNVPHVGFARKYRPLTFGEVVGQETVTVTLKNAVDSGQPAHAYLFFGPRGVGKTTTARILAKALNCRRGPTPEPCLECPPCAEIAASSSIDVLELDAATHTQVDRIREMIIETVSLAPSRDRYKIFIIDEVHMLSTASFNALLKTLEEPPAHVVFILATTAASKIPATIVSRCQRFRFRPMPAAVLAGHLKELAKREKIKADAASLDLLARAAGGSFRDAVSLLDQAHAYAGGALSAEQATELLGALPEETLRALAEAVLAKDVKSLAAVLRRLLEEGYEPSQTLRDLRDRFQAAYMHRLGVEDSLEGKWKTLAEAQSPETFSYLVRRVNKAMEEARHADSPRLALELGLFGMIEAAYDLREWVLRLEALERRLASGALPKPAAGTLQPSAGAAGEAAENVWPAVIRELQGEKPGLSASLEGARLLPSGDSEWRLVFQRAFELEQAQKSQSLIEAKLSSIVGRKLRLALEVAAQSQRKEEASGEKAAAQWEEVDAAVPIEDPGVKKVLEIFPGSVKHLKKKP